MKYLTPILSALFIVILAGLVSADFSIPESSTCPQSTIDNCQAIADIGVETGKSVPPIVPEESIINMYLMDDTIIGHVTVEAGIIQSTVCCREHDNHTHVAKVTNTSVLNEIQNADDPLSEADNRLKNEEITFVAESFGDKTRLAVAKAFLRIRNWFS